MDVDVDLRLLRSFVTMAERATSAAPRDASTSASQRSASRIENLRRSDQAHSDGADATRTERGFHASSHGVSAGQGEFRWAGMGVL